MYLLESFSIHILEFEGKQAVENARPCFLNDLGVGLLPKAFNEDHRI
jgi:hypothetical protein